MPQAAYVRCNSQETVPKEVLIQVSMPQAAYVRCNPKMEELSSNMEYGFNAASGICSLQLIHKNLERRFYYGFNAASGICSLQPGAGRDDECSV